MIGELQSRIASLVLAVYKETVVVELTRPEPQFGDFSTNVALQLAKKIGRNPREVAQEIANGLTQDEKIASVEVAGPGFINICLSDGALLAESEQPFPQVFNENFVIEYSCPNAFKELHTGHLYNTIFGDILARIMERSGARVTRTSFGGDVGLHVAKCVWGMVAELGGEDPEKLADVEPTPFGRAQWISACYVRGAAAYEEDAATKEAIDELNKTIYGLHEMDDRESPLAQIYWMTRQWSYDYFEAFYALIDVDQMRYYPESSTMPTGMKVVDEQLKLGNLQKSEGAVVFPEDKERHLHTRVFVTSKGLPTYETKDIGVIWLEKADYDFQKRILITGNDQKEYMRVVFAATELFRPELAGTMTHITNGTVRFADGQKMSSRLGNVSRAADVIEVVKEKVAALVKDDTLVHPVALGAIKYAFAKNRLGGDIAFDIDETVSLQGNSGPYLQYAHARARSILSKADPADQIVIADGTEATFTPDERLLLQKLSEYNEVITKSARQYAQHHICTYLYELAQEFNRFYEKNRVIGDEREGLRVALVQKYADTLQNGLHILGITTPERM